MTAVVLGGPEEALGHAVAGHPERPDRVRAAMAGVRALELGTDLVELPPREATTDELARAHSPAYLRELQDACRDGIGLDPDTYVLPGSWTAAVRAAGAGLAVVDRMKSGGGDVGFVASRPPGHHATARRGMGFCLLNNVAVAAAGLAELGDRVAIIDWDVHHGNGTQDIFWDDDRVLYVSTHQAPFYPGTGRVGDTGGPHAVGSTVNIPLPAGATGDVVVLAFEEVITPVIERFSPAWVLVSAGFDAHRDDPLADLALSAGDFAALARVVARFAPEPGRLVLFLEGGYDLEALASSVTATLGALVGQRLPTEPPTAGGPGADAVASAGFIQAQLQREART